MTPYEAATQPEPSGPARYEQEVRLTVRMAVTGEHAAFTETTTDRLRLAIEQAIKAYMPPILLDATIEIYASRGPGGFGYVFPGEDRPIAPGTLIVTLDEVLTR